MHGHRFSLRVRYFEALDLVGCYRRLTRTNDELVLKSMCRAPHDQGGWIGIRRRRERLPSETGQQDR